MLKVCKNRLPKVKSSYKLLPTTPFKYDGDVFVRDYVFIIIINNLNHIINLNSYGHHIMQIDNNYRYVMTVLNHATNEQILNQKGKLKLINVAEQIPKCIYHNQRCDKLANLGIHLISMCGALDYQAYSAYLNLYKAWHKYHNNKKIAK